MKKQPEKKTEKKTEVLNIRLTKTDKKILFDTANKNNISIAKLLLQTTLKK